MKRRAVGVPDCTIQKDAGPCEACAEGKMPASLFPASTSCAEFIFDLVHSDLMELPTKTCGGLRYVLTFLDDHTSHTWISVIRKKSDAAKHIKEFVTMVQTQFGKVIKEWQIDGGGELASGKLLEFLKEKGILIRKSLPYMHQQNGHVERFNCTITNKMQTM
jgi:transposase InsO family protein